MNATDWRTRIVGLRKKLERQIEHALLHPHSRQANDSVKFTHNECCFAILAYHQDFPDKALQFATEHGIVFAIPEGGTS